MELEGIDHVALSVLDVEQSARWYAEVLSFERRHDDVWHGVPIFLTKGRTGLALFRASANAQPSSEKQIAMRHLALRADWKNFHLAQQELKTRGIPFEFQNHEIAHSIYFRDPDGHRLEITTYDLPTATKRQS